MHGRTRLRTALKPLAAGVVAAVLLAAPAHRAVAQTAAAEVSDARAKALEADIRAWIAARIGAAVDVATLPLRVVAGGDSYRLELPFGGPAIDGHVQVGEGVVSARIKQLDDNRWAIEEMRVPSSWKVTLDEALQSADKSMPSLMSMKIASQDMHGVLDTSLATTSSLDAELRGYSMVIEDPQGTQATHADRISTHLAWLPSGQPGVGTVSAVSSLTNYAARSPMPDGTPMEIGAARIEGSLKMEGVSMAGADALLHAAATLGAAARGRADAPAEAFPKAGVPEADKAAARALVRSLAGMMERMTGEQTYEEVHLKFGESSGTLRKLSIGFDMAAPHGKGELAWRIGLDGLDSAMIPEGVYRDYLPKHLALTPHIGGLPKRELVDLVLRAIDDPDVADNVMANLTALLDKGPLRLGVSDIALDIGPARLSGGGGVTVTAPDAMTGKAMFRATGLDALIKRANTTPELKMAAPALIFLKGIGVQEGNATIWRITYADNKVMVNDTDLSAMIPGK